MNMEVYDRLQDQGMGRRLFENCKKGIDLVEMLLDLETTEGGFRKILELELDKLKTLRDYAQINAEEMGCLL